MIIGSVSENKDTEKRISVTPENVKKYISNGFKVYLEKNYGQHLDIIDEKFSENGARNGSRHPRHSRKAGRQTPQYANPRSA